MQLSLKLVDNLSHLTQTAHHFQNILVHVHPLNLKIFSCIFAAASFLLLLHPQKSKQSATNLEKLVINSNHVREVK